MRALQPKMPVIVITADERRQGAMRQPVVANGRISKNRSAGTRLLLRFAQPSRSDGEQGGRARWNLSTTR